MLLIIDHISMSEYETDYETVQDDEEDASQTTDGTEPEINRGKDMEEFLCSAALWFESELKRTFPKRNVAIFPIATSFIEDMLATMYQFAAETSSMMNAFSIISENLRYMSLYQILFKSYICPKIESGVYEIPGVIQGTSYKYPYGSIFLLKI
jgi:hypothetical protein